MRLCACGRALQPVGEASDKHTANQTLFERSEAKLL